MRESRAICLLCRSRSIVATALNLGAPWHASARFSTASQGAPTTSPREDESIRDLDPLFEKPSSGKTVPPTLIPADLARRPKPWTKRRDRPKIRGNRALAVFEKVVNEQRGGEAKTDTRPPKPGLGLYHDLAQLKGMRAQIDTPLSACFDFFNHVIYPQLQACPEVPNVFRADATRLLRSISKAKSEDYTAKELPTATQITQIRRQLDILQNPTPWAPLILGLVEHICNMGTSPGDFASLEGFEGAQAWRESLLKDLIEAWRMFCLPDRMVSNAQKLLKTPGEFRLPPPNLRVLSKHRKSRDICCALATLFPRYAPSQVQSIVPAVIATYVLLEDATKTGPAIKRNAQEFLDAVAGVLAIVPADLGALREMLAPYPGLALYVSDRWQHLPRIQMGEVQVQKPNIRYTYRDGGARKSLEDIHKQLGQALRSRNLDECEQVWYEFWGPDPDPDAGKMAQLGQNEEVFNYFILAFATLHQPNRVVTTWAAMEKVGIKPSLKTWTSLIEGCKKAANADGIHNVWRRLVASGMQLDSVVWTSRISGLIHAGDLEGGLGALDEMQRVWDESLRKGRPSMAVKPSIEPVNAAIAGLLREREHGVRAARDVLKWAGRHGIEPDVITYNTLLRRFVREGQDNEAEGIMVMMKKQGLQADLATFTIILDGALSSLGAESPEAQLETVSRVLSEMEAAGQEANMQTYGKMIYLLLQEGDHAEGTVKALLGHIWAKGLALSSQIYTMLAEHYFSRARPDLAAVEQLIENRGLDDKLGIDRVFWERVVKGFAQAGDTASALKYFEKIAKSLSVTTLTLEELLSALIRKQQWEEAADLVRKVKSHRELGKGSYDDTSDSRFWRHRFWHVASEHGLLDERPGHDV